MVGSQEESEGGYPDGTAHLLEHSIFLGETDETRALYSSWNGFTSLQETAYQSSSSTEKFVEGVEAKIDMIYNFTKYPNIKDEVNAVDNE